MGQLPAQSFQGGKGLWEQESKNYDDCGKAIQAHSKPVTAEPQCQKGGNCRRQSALDQGAPAASPAAVWGVPNWRAPLPNHLGRSLALIQVFSRTGLFTRLIPRGGFRFCNMAIQDVGNDLVRLHAGMGVGRPDPSLHALKIRRQVKNFKVVLRGKTDAGASAIRCDHAAQSDLSSPF